jgi:hypothetical protein
MVKVQQFSGRQGQGHSRALIYHRKRLNGKGFVDGARDTVGVARFSVGGAKLSDEIARSSHGYTNDMDYNVGSRIRVRLYSAKIVEAEITAITNQSVGRKLQIVYGNVTASINPAQITEVLPAT